MIMVSAHGIQTFHSFDFLIVGPPVPLSGSDGLLLTLRHPTCTNIARVLRTSTTTIIHVGISSIDLSLALTALTGLMVLFDLSLSLCIPEHVDGEWLVGYLNGSWSITMVAVVCVDC